ncbi:hypothetical protein [Neolewinella litorea]|uniref:DUF3142 domain-containing protein n=1 Tax=Neolewinella litorea TaxID=2562452 RepID=A0A4S4NKL9_9BACT|nr:hypothetical protein [Neolewinella litorea]THH39495.1 hypothetical protein E4021_12155 [Neolewinella litorea]
MRCICSLLLLLAFSCGAENIPPPRYAFYHWQTDLTLPPNRLADYDVQRLYIKAFDISWTDGQPQPSALLVTGQDSLPREAVPVVFITNEVFAHPAPSLIPDLLTLLEEVFPYPYTELQIDCDWTAGTRDAYFSFLQALRDATGLTISCTVRLHQYRDRKLQGIPPVDRAVLMAYNTGDLERWETDNSIVDPTIIAQYVENQPPYPLPLDLAVAAYDWAVVYRQGRLAYLINEPDLRELADTFRFTPLSRGRYQVDSSTYYGGLYLYRSDMIRHEVADTALARRLGRDLWPRIANPGSRYLIYYRIGSRQWNNSGN